MAVRLYFDHDSGTRAVVAVLRAAGVDVLTSREAGNERLPDEEQLRFALADTRAIYTSNVADYARLHTNWMRAGLSHAGIVARRRQRLAIADQARGLLAICHEFEAIGLGSQLLFVDNWTRGDIAPPGV